MWQSFLQTRTDLAFLSVAVDVAPERVRPFAAEHPFPTVVDSAGQLGRLFDFDVVPNGVFVDELGIVRFVHIGGFDIQRPEVAAQVDALLAADFGTAGVAAPVLLQEAVEIEVLRSELAARPEDAGLQFALGDALLREGRGSEAETVFRRATELDRDDWSVWFGLGSALFQQERTTEALASWRAALALDPANFTVRKQIWMIEHPERFYPTIDFQWQAEQLEREGYVR